MLLEGKVSHRYNVLHMPRQHSCRALCKITKRSFHYNLNESKMKFSPSLNVNGKIFNEVGPLSVHREWWHQSTSSVYIGGCGNAMLRSNLWSSQFVTLSQFVTESVAICDGCRDLWQQMLQFVTTSKYAMLWHIFNQFRWICCSFISYILIWDLFLASVLTFCQQRYRIYPRVIWAIKQFSNGTKLKVSQWCQTFKTIIS